MSYPEDFSSVGHFATVDTKNAIVYILNNCGELFEINLNTKSVNTLYIDNNKIIEMNFGEFPGIIYANDTIHVIGGGEIEEHFIFDRQNEKFISTYNFEDVGRISSPTSLYFKTNKSIITTSWIQPDDQVKPQENQKEGEEKPIVSIMEYINDKWTDLYTTHNYEFESLFECNIVSTISEDYIIFIDGASPTCVDGYRGFFVYNVAEKSLIKSDIKLPWKCASCAVMTRDANMMRY